MIKALTAALVFAATATAALAQAAPPPEAIKELAPTGKLRVAINLGNIVLAQKDAAGNLGGVSVELARELAKRLGGPAEMITFDAAGKVFAALKSGVWDIAFLAIEPVRAAEVSFSPPYVVIEGSYMVRKGSPLKVNADVDKPGIRIAVGQGSAYDLFLTRTLKNATLVRSSTSAEAPELFVKDKLDAVAGVRQPIVIYAKAHPEMRVMDGHFQVIEQAMGTPKGREAGSRYLHAFIEEMKANGFVAGALKRTNQPDAAVAPPAK